MGNRRQRFRDVMRALDPAEDPALAIDAGRYVRPPRGLARQIAVRLEVEPTSSHLVMGGGGSGKTTELLQAKANLERVDDVLVGLVDVGRHQQLERLEPGILLALAGKVALEKTPTSPEAASARWHIERYGLGGEFDIGDLQAEDRPDPDDRYHATVDGVLSAPERVEVVEILERALRVVVDHAQRETS